MAHNTAVTRTLALGRMPVAILVTLALTGCEGAPPAAEPPATSPAPAAPVPETTDAEAQALLLEAREKGRGRSRSGTMAAIGLLEKAVRRDPKFVRAWAELALAYGTVDDATDPLVRRPRAKGAAQRAVALDDRSAAARAALGFVRYRFDWQWSEAEAEFAKALAANPNDAFARHQHGVFLAATGRTSEGLAELSLALQADPSSAAVRADMVAPLLRASRIAEARAAIDAVAAALPDSPLVPQLQSDVHAAEGRMDESVEQLWKALGSRRISTGRINQLRQAYKAGGAAQMTEARIRQLTADIESGPSPPSSYQLATELARAHASLKHRERTLHWLAVAIDLHEDAPLYMRSSPLFDFLRDDPRFRELLRRAKLDLVSR